MMRLKQLRQIERDFFEEHLEYPVIEVAPGDYLDLIDDAHKQRLVATVRDGLTTAAPKGIQIGSATTVYPSKAVPMGQYRTVAEARDIPPYEGPDDDLPF
jgi:hypothetical protein